MLYKIKYQMEQRSYIENNNERPEKTDFQTAVILLELLRSEREELRRKIMVFAPEICERSLRKLEGNLSRAKQEISRNRESEESRIKDKIAKRMEFFLKGNRKQIEGIMRYGNEGETGELENILSLKGVEILDEVEREEAEAKQKMIEREREIADKIRQIKDRLREKQQLEELLSELKELLPPDRAEEKKEEKKTNSISHENSDRPPRKKRGKRRKSRAGSNKEQKNGKPKESEWDQTELDLGKLKTAIEIANENGRTPKIRVLLPKKQGNKRVSNLERKWRKVFRNVGFEGKIEPTSIEDLQNTDDKTTPVVMARGMNVHGEHWHPKSFENVFVIYTQVNHFPKRPFAGK